MKEQPLRILCVINLPRDPRLGANRVWMELAQEWRGAGHAVDHFTLSEAFPKATSRNAVLSLRQARFARRAARFIRQNAGKYDVVDALLGTVPCSKRRLRFRGLLVARSVGFFWLYQQFEEKARWRWANLPRGKFLGRIFYNLTRRLALRDAARAITHSDLLNLPNDDELASLRNDLHSAKAAIVQPYGLPQRRRIALADAALPSEKRIAAPTISFVGMWSLRKGSRDLGEIVRRVRDAVPNVRFRFLGTFTSDENVLRDLGLQRCDWCEIVREYDPAELPSLLSDCTAGIFPSYVEGFGLSLLEQLAAEVPTVAYDAPGPRQILAPLRDELLVAAGDALAMSDRIINILRLPLAFYAELQKRGADVAKGYCWSQIAASTIDAYRSALRSNGDPIIFTQPFGWRSPGGGARIMRALLQDASLPIQVVCTSPQRPPKQRETEETHVPLRPFFGRLERSRFAGLPHATAPFFAQRFRRRLERLCPNARAVHAVAHGGLDFFHALEFAREKARPFFLHVHDDFIYTTHDHGRAEHALAAAWCEAAARFVISDQLGREYQRRYGARDYVVVTDGVSEVAAAPRPRTSGQLRVYFMGLYHLEYEENFRALLQSLSQLNEAGLFVRMQMRCGSVPRTLKADFVQVLPFANETEVERDLSQADLLYLPLPFAPEHAPFVRFSLSTKLVTYLGSGIPILYHGAREAALGELLARRQAALLYHSLDSAQLSGILREFAGNPALGDSVAARAIQLARDEFFLPVIREKFWSTIERALAA